MLARQLLTFLALASSVLAAEQWIKLNPEGTAPPPQVTTAVYDHVNNRMIVFGANTGPGPINLSNKVWVLKNANGLGGMPEWLELAPTGTLPTPRGGPMTVYDAANNMLIVYAGYASGGGALTDLWVLNHANGLGGAPQWTKLAYLGTPPPQRAWSQRPSYDPSTNRLMLFGGCDNGCSVGNYVNEVWTLSNANGLNGIPQFTQLYPTGGPPAKRNDFGSGYDSTSNRLIIFGGGDEWPPKFNDTWVLANANGLGGVPEWIRLYPTTVPPDRYDMSSAYDRTTNKLYVVGGVTGGAATNDVWRLDNANGLGGTPDWVQLFPSGGPPPVWNGILQVSAFDPVNKRMIIFAGITQGGLLLNEVWVLALGSPADTTPPVITPHISPLPNAAGWNNAPVAVAWEVGDPESAIASSSGCEEAILSSQTAGVNLTCSATNGADLSSTLTVTIRIDTTAPVVTLTTPGDGTSYGLGSSVTASYGCTDALSGVASCTGTLPGGASIDTSIAGQNRSFMVAGTDSAGNSTTVTHSYSVVYAFNGFLPPIANPPVVNIAKAGQTIPVKWQLLDSGGKYISDVGAVASLQSAPSACDAAPSVIIGDTVEPAGGSSLRYDAVSQQFVYNWQTSKSWTGCWTLQLTLNDGTTHLAKFSFK